MRCDRQQAEPLSLSLSHPSLDYSNSPISSISPGLSLAGHLWINISLAPANAKETNLPCSITMHEASTGGVVGTREERARE